MQKDFFLPSSPQNGLGSNAIFSAQKENFPYRFYCDTQTPTPPERERRPILLFLPMTNSSKRNWKVKFIQAGESTNPFWFGSSVRHQMAAPPSSI